MTIEELKELRRKIAPTDFAYSTDFNVLIDLIDAEIARLSITDGDIREAISILDKDIRMCAPTWDSLKQDTIHSNKAIDLAIQALQVYRTEPCEWCRERESGTSLVYDIFHDYFNLTGATEIMSFSRCPNCGRKLTED